ncbi:MAG: CotH kinase family protein [Bacteroidales bacterium]
MVFRRLIVGAAIIGIISTAGLYAQNFYDINTIQKIEIQFSQSNWDYMLDTAAQGSEGYIYAHFVKINGLQFDSVGVKYKGNSSYNPNNQKNPLHIELDTYVENQNYQGYKDIKLSNGFKDPTFVREVLSYSIARNYMTAPLSNYAQVYINGQKIGLYSNSESVSKSFVSTHFYADGLPLFKCNSPCTAAGPQAPNLVFYGTDSSLYYCRYEMKSDHGWAELVDLISTLSSDIASIGNILDVDRALWMLAFDNVLVNLDSYIGAPTQNYYLAMDQTARFNPVLWDLNETFGVFQNSGTINLNTLLAKQQMTPLLHINDNNWPLIKNLLAVPIYKKMYIAHMRTILNENFSNTDYITQALNLQSIIDTAVQSDQHKFFTYAQFLSNVNTSINQPGGQIPGLGDLMNARFTYLSNHMEFQQTPPVITSVSASEPNPSMDTTIYITATVNGANAVMMGLRNSTLQKFIRVPMFDDGLHGDGSASDGIYGAAMTITAPQMQYYIYAENNNAGIFSPERAEYEYYTLNASIAVINAGDLVINEFMALNNSWVQAPNGDYEDWIELYNTSQNTLALTNLYISDSYTNPMKFKFPDGQTLGPQSYLIVWADYDTTNPVGLHGGFKLSGGGERLILSYPGLVIDSVSFGQQAEDVSYARCPNGTGPFQPLTPTFNALNCNASGFLEHQAGQFRIFPNPASGVVIIESDREEINTIEISNFLGQQVFFSDQHSERNTSIDVTSFHPGLYFVRINSGTTQKLAVGKGGN